MGIKLKTNLLFSMASVLFCTVAFAQEKPTVSLLTKIDTSITQDNALDTIPLVSLDGDNENVGSVQTVSSFAGGGRDAFNNAAIFNFGPVRFQQRAYDRDNFATYMNGVRMEDFATGFSTTGLWSGLGDETRNRLITLGLRSNPYTFGAAGGATFIDTRASKQRRQTSISFTRSSTLFKDIFSITYSTGMKKGWAFTFSGNRRYSDNGYVEGTYTNSWSYFFGVDKKIGTKQLLSLVVFGAPSETGLQGHATKESFALAGSNYYNPDWGYQDGKVRNAHVAKSNQPTGILTHDFSISKRTSLMTAVSYTFGERSSSSIDWFDAPNPAPDYYSSLPSDQIGTGPNYTVDSNLYNQLTTLFRNSKAARQINWQQLYNVNRMSHDSIVNVDGVAGKTVTGHRSLYVVRERVTNTQKLNFNTTLNTLLTDNITLTAGLSYQMQKDENFERVNDLLGGDFFVNVDQYAQLDFPGDPNKFQNDLRDPNRIVHVGDKYGYDYEKHINKGTGWAQGVYHKKNLELFLAGEASYTSFWRVGLYQNGLYADNSYGKSTVNNFSGYSAKAGASYKLDRGNYLYLNAAVISRAPYFQDAYIDPEINNASQQNLRNQTIQSIEGGYVYNSPILNLRLTGYYSTFQHGFNLTQYYSYSYGEFIDYALSNINTVQFGGELGAEAKIAKNLTASAAASIGRAYYDSRQLVTVSQDNSSTLLANPNTLVFTQNYRLPNTPQEAINLGLNYRSRHYWYASLSANYFDQMWVEMLPDRRTAAAVQGVDPKTQAALFHSIIDQEKYPAEFMLNFRAGKSWRLNNIAGIKKSFLFSINAGINNLLNNQNVISNAYENGETTKFPTGVFPTRYQYADGITYFVKATLRFY